MPYYVYIIQSELDQSYYKGFSENPLNRLAAHNNGESTYTSIKIPWTLVYVEELTTKREALIRERALKKYSHAQVLSLIAGPKNIIGSFTGSAG